MSLYFEWGIKQLNKRGEELCGDSVAVSRQPDSVTVAMSDGLGSGVKASILATLTTQIAMHLLQHELPVSDVVETLGKTLPVCAVRKLAYSTFAIAKFFRDGRARIVEFDTPPTILLRDRKRLPLEYGERTIADKKVRECLVELNQGDCVVLFSDGVLNAGIDGVYPLGWGLDAAAQFLESHAHPGLGAQEVADQLAQTVLELYAGRAGDDVSIVVIKARHKITATVLTGPPAGRAMDQAVLRRFAERRGLHVVCGGTTATIAARRLGASLEVDLETMRPDVPPLAHMPGMDLVTEGILTLT